MALYNWGTALQAQAEAKSGEDADRLFAEAGEKYQAALAIKPDHHEALNSWGNAHLQNAAKKTGEERRRLLDLALEKLSEGLKPRLEGGSVQSHLCRRASGRSGGRKAASARR